MQRNKLHHFKKIGATLMVSSLLSSCFLGEDSTVVKQGAMEQQGVIQTKNELTYHIPQNVLENAVYGDGYIEIEGDMRFSRAETETVFLAKSADVSSNVDLNSGRWANGIIPYIIDATVNAERQEWIEQAIYHWNTYTNLKFIPALSSHIVKVKFQAPIDVLGCWSSVGRMISAGEQAINLTGCWDYESVAHEMGHAIGLQHEHSRFDRDSHVTISGNWTDDLVNWRIIGDAVGSYDPNSIMQYGIGNYDYNTDDGTRIQVTMSSDGEAFNQVDGLSLGDIGGANRLYPDLWSIQANSAASWDNTRYDVYAMTGNGDLHQYYRKLDGTIGNYGAKVNLPSNIKFNGPVTAGSWDTGRMDIFGMNVDGDILQVYYQNGWKSGNIGNPFGANAYAGPLALGSWGDGRYDIFGLDNDKNILRYYFDMAGARRWVAETLPNPFSGTEFMGSITVGSWANNRYDLFGLDANKNILQYWTNGSSWYAGNLGNPFAPNEVAGSLTVASWGEGRYDIFGLDKDGNILQYLYDGGWRSGTLTNGFSNNRFVGTITVESSEYGKYDIFGKGLNGEILHLYYTLSTGWKWENLGSNIL